MSNPQEEKKVLSNNEIEQTLQDSKLTDDKTSNPQKEKKILSADEIKQTLQDLNSELTDDNIKKIKTGEKTIDNIMIKLTKLKSDQNKNFTDEQKNLLEELDKKISNNLIAQRIKYRFDVIERKMTRNNYKSNNEFNTSLIQLKELIRKNINNIQDKNIFKSNIEVLENRNNYKNDEQIDYTILEIKNLLFPELKAEASTPPSRKSTTPGASTPPPKKSATDSPTDSATGSSKPGAKAEASSTPEAKAEASTPPPGSVDDYKRLGYDEMTAKKYSEIYKNIENIENIKNITNDDQKLNYPILYYHFLDQTQDLKSDQNKIDSEIKANKYIENYTKYVETNVTNRKYSQKVARDITNLEIDVVDKIDTNLEDIKNKKLEADQKLKIIDNRNLDEEKRNKALEEFKKLSEEVSKIWRETDFFAKSQFKIINKTYPIPKSYLQLITKLQNPWKDLKLSEKDQKNLNEIKSIAEDLRKKAKEIQTIFEKQVQKSSLEAEKERIANQLKNKLKDVKEEYGKADKEYKNVVYLEKYIGRITKKSEADKPIKILRIKSDNINQIASKVENIYNEASSDVDKYYHIKMGSKGFIGKVRYRIGKWWENKEWYTDTFKFYIKERTDILLVPLAGITNITEKTVELSKKVNKILEESLNKVGRKVEESKVIEDSKVLVKTIKSFFKTRSRTNFENILSKWNNLENKYYDFNEKKILEDKLRELTDKAYKAHTEAKNNCNDQQDRIKIIDSYYQIINQLIDEIRIELDKDEFGKVKPKETFPNTMVIKGTKGKSSSVSNPISTSSSTPTVEDILKDIKKIPGYNPNSPAKYIVDTKLLDNAAKYIHNFLLYKGVTETIDDNRIKNLLFTNYKNQVENFSNFYIIYNGYFNEQKLLGNNNEEKRKNSFNDIYSIINDEQSEEKIKEVLEHFRKVSATASSTNTTGAKPAPASSSTTASSSTNTTGAKPAPASSTNTAGSPASSPKAGGGNAKLENDIKDFIKLIKNLKNKDKDNIFNLADNIESNYEYNITNINNQNFSKTFYQARTKLIEDIIDNLKKQVTDYNNELKNDTNTKYDAFKVKYNTFNDKINLLTLRNINKGDIKPILNIMDEYNDLNNEYNTIQ